MAGFSDSLLLIDLSYSFSFAISKYTKFALTSHFLFLFNTCTGRYLTYFPAVFLETVLVQLTFQNCRYCTEFHSHQHHCHCPYRCSVPKPQDCCSRIPFHVTRRETQYVNKKVQLDAAICRHLFTARSLAVNKCLHIVVSRWTFLLTLNHGARNHESKKETQYLTNGTSSKYCHFFSTVSTMH